MRGRAKFAMLGSLILIGILVAITFSKSCWVNVNSEVGMLPLLNITHFNVDTWILASELANPNWNRLAVATIKVLLDGRVAGKLAILLLGLKISLSSNFLKS